MTRIVRLSPGFTLIELSIVLVIIGLLAAGILVGKDLIRAADIRAQVAQIEKINTAVITFKVKYNCLPADCKDAVALGLGGQDGNGNGTVESIPGQYHGGEMNNFWTHMQAANLSQYPLYDVVMSAGTEIIPAPIAKMDQYFFANGFSGRTVLWIANQSFHFYDSAPRHFWWFNSYPIAGFSSTGLLPINAYAIDIKIDDGEPASGQTQVQGYHNSYLGNEDGCIDDVSDPGKPHYSLKSTSVSPSTYSNSGSTGIYNSACVLYTGAPF